MSTRWRLLIALPVLGLLVLWTVLGITYRAQPARAPVRAASAVATLPPLVQICKATPCPKLQILEVFDGYGNPGFTVGEIGGVGVLGDNLTLSGKTRTEDFHHFVVLSEVSPVAYDRRFGLSNSCTSPGVWLEPGGLWACAAGRWVLRIRL